MTADELSRKLLIMRTRKLAEPGMVFLYASDSPPPADLAATCTEAAKLAGGWCEYVEPEPLGAGLWGGRFRAVA
ncbi:MAG: hypothetical protein Q8P18_33160 [Pseudomonadota bacterium]|nr:hypothetical protein [Pseudomonadota bacterium]